MSFFNSIEQAVSQLKTSIGNELSATEQNLEQLISNVANDVKSEFEAVFTKIRDQLDNEEIIIRTKMDNVDRLLINAKDAIENGAEATYRDFMNKTEAEIRRIKALASESISSMTSASTYIRNRAEYDIKHALDIAKQTFTTARDDFESDVASIVDAAISKTKQGINSLIDDAREGTTRLNSLREEVDDEIKSKFSTIEHDLISLKRKFRGEMDEVVSFGRRETKKIEARFEAMAVSAKSVANSVAVASLLFCIAAGLSIIYIRINRS